MTTAPAARDPISRLRALSGRPLAATFAATIAISGFNVLTGIILARALGPVGRGEVQAAFIWPTLIQFVVMLGAVEAVTFRAARPDTKLDRLAGTSIRLALAQAGLMLGIGAILLPIVLLGHSGRTLAASFVFLATMAIAILALHMASFLNGAGRYRAYNVLRTAVIGLRALVMVPLAAIGSLTVMTAMLSYAAGVVPVTIAGFALVRKLVGGIGRPDRALFRALTSYGWRSQLSSTRNPLNEQLDQFVIALFLAPVELGLYAVAATVTMAIGFVSATVAIVALPRLAQSDDAAQRVAIARRYIGGSFLAAVAIAAALVAVAPNLLEVVFGADFKGATDATRILLAASVMTSLTRVAAAALNGIERPGDAGIGGVLSLGGVGVGITVLLPLLGIEGAALAVLFGYTLSSAWCLLRLGRGLGVNPLSVLLPPPPRRQSPYS